MIKFLKEKKTNIFFILFFIIVFILSTQLMPKLSGSFSKISGITVKAYILLGAVISASLLQGKKYASYFALAAGFLFDVFVGNPYALSPIVYFLCAYSANFAASPFSRKTPLSVLLISAALLLIKALFSFFYLFATASSGGQSAVRLILSGVLPEYVANILAAVIVFTVMRILMAIFRIPVREDIGK